MTQASKVDAPTVLATDLTKSYPRRRADEPEFALESLSVAVTAGQAALLVGANGAGKSTALRLLAGIELPTRGTVRLFGDSPRTMDVRRRMAYLSDSSELFPFLDTSETLDFFGAAADVPRARRRERAAELVELLEMEAWGKKRVKTFSLGMRRRLGIACVLMGTPDLLLLDEPAAGLDPDGLRLFHEIIVKEKERGCTVILSSHHLGRAQVFCDRWVVLERGRVVLDGSGEEIAERVGRVDVMVSGLSTEALEALRGDVEQRGGAWEGRRVSEEGLEDTLLRRRETDG